MVAGWPLWGLVLAGPARAQEAAADEDLPQVGEGAEVVVEDRRVAPSTASRSLDRAAVEALPARTTADLLRAMPGLHMSSHGGRGKAAQFLLRGFDAQHGADLAVDLEGVPLNEVSSVHAHGYLDLEVVPAVLVEGMRLDPGVGSAASGDFAVAGAARLDLGLARPGGQVALGGGTDRSAALGLAWRPVEAPAGSFLAAEVDGGQGIGEGRSWRQARGGAGAEGAVGAARGRVWLLAQGARFASPGTLREDEVAAGTIDFYGAHRGAGGGETERVVGAASLAGGDAAGPWELTLWSGWRSLSLDQNFTGGATDPVHGDGSRQTHVAGSGGLRVHRGWAGRPRARLTAGADLRLDRFHQGIQPIDWSGQPWAPAEERSALQGGAAGWTEAVLQPAPRLVLIPGLRAGLFGISAAATSPAWAPLLAPKLRGEFLVNDDLSVLFAAGRGHRPPDARAVSSGGRAPIARADSAELGATLRPGPRLVLRAAGFGTRVSDEIVFDHVAGRYLATGRTRRLGVDGGLQWWPRAGLRTELSATWVDGIHVATGAPIPTAPRLLVVAGAYAEARSVGAATLTGGLRAWALGPRALPGGLESQPTAVVDLTATLRGAVWGLSAEVDNLLGTRWRDGEFLFPSSWGPSPAASELPVRHFTAGTPRTARLTVLRSF